MEISQVRAVPEAGVPTFAEVAGHVSRLLQQGLMELADARRHLNCSFQQVEQLPGDLTGATEAQLESVAAVNAALWT